MEQASMLAAVIAAIKMKGDIIGQYQIASLMSDHIWSQR